MLIFTDKRIAFLAVPKTGTTAVEMALRPKADIIFSRRRKHVPAQRFRNRVAPFLDSTFGINIETVAVMREPVDQLRSWFKYRKSERTKGGENSTDGLDFDGFISAVISDTPPPYASVGSQHGFLCNKRGDLLVDHLFSYERQDAFLSFLSDRLETEIELKRKNVSPSVPAELSIEMQDKLRAARPADFALYARLMQNGGYLRGDAG